jgi:hypothetical protein
LSQHSRAQEILIIALDVSAEIQPLIISGKRHLGEQGSYDRVGRGVLRTQAKN